MVSWKVQICENMFQQLLYKNGERADYCKTTRVTILSFLSKKKLLLCFKNVSNGNKLANGWFRYTSVKNKNSNIEASVPWWTPRIRRSSWRAPIWRRSRARPEPGQCELPQPHPHLGHNPVFRWSRRAGWIWNIFSLTFFLVTNFSIMMILNWSVHVCVLLF